MKAASWALRRSPQRSRTDRGQLVRGHDAGQHGVLPVVADVGHPVGPADHLALGGGRCRTGPAVVGDAVDRLGAEVEGGQRDVRPPRRMVEAAREERVEGVLAGVPARAVPAVVAQGDRLGQGHVEPAGPGHRRGHLGHLECVGEAGALVVLGEDEHLGLAGQAAERGGVQYPVPVPLEAGAPLVGLLGPGPARRPPTPRRGARSEEAVLLLLAGPPSGSGRRRRRTARRRIGAGGPAGRSGRRSRRAPGGPGPSSPTWSRPNAGCGPISRVPALRDAGSCHAVCPFAVTSKCPQAPAGTVERSQIRWTCASESSRPPRSWRWS